MTAPTFETLARQIRAVGKRFYARGWALGTSGNYSAVCCRDPFRLAVTASSVHKGEMRPSHVLEVDDAGRTVAKRRGRGAPSAETLLHVEIARRFGSAVGAVLHTHSIWGTMLSGMPEHRHGMAMEGFEMLNGLSGVRTHEHREWIPIVENDQDMPRLANAVRETLDRNPDAHAFLLRRHGLYTWGATLTEAERHVEILEFLLETIGRTASFGSRAPETHHGTFENS